MAHRPAPVRTAASLLCSSVVRPFFGTALAEFPSFGPPWSAASSDAWSGEGVQPLLPEAARLLPEPVRRLAAWCVVLLLVTGVVVVGIRLCAEFRTAVVPVLLALLGTALLGPLYRRLVKAKVNRSVAAALTCTAVVAVVGGATYIVVAALIDSGDEIISSLRRAAESLGELGPLAKSAVERLERATKDEDETVRTAATKALKSIRG